MPPRRSFHDRIADAVWSDAEPSPEERRQLEAVRASVRAEARQSEDMYDAELYRAGAGRGVMAPPPRAERVRSGTFRGEYRRGGSGAYDWFDGLAKAEQARLRENGWFASEGRGESPDEVATRIDIGEWLQLTRNTDMARAMATGHHTNPARYGGQDPRDLIAGSPYDFSELHHANTGRAARHLRHASEGGFLGAEPTSRCQFRTRPDGTVYPLAGTCNPREPAVGYTVNARGELATTGTRGYGEDEAF